MNAGSSSESLNKAERGKKGGGKLGSVLSRIDPFVPRTDHNPRELRSWAKRTGFVSTSLTGETGTSASEKNNSAGFDFEQSLGNRGGGSSPKIEIDPVLGRTRPNRRAEIEPASGSGNGGRRNENDGVLGSRDGAVVGENQGRRFGDEHVLEVRNEGRKVDLNGNGRVNGVVNRIGNGVGVTAGTPVMEPKKDGDKAETDMEMNLHPDGEEPAFGEWRGPSGMKCGLRENPGVG